ncbi:hypothetical protein I317_07444 [Kwoniella heveanensis CBS 569]|nr:hypothetical protein I317_07444 [Kwoniella heveanensis CBS 569]
MPAGINALDSGNPDNEDGFNKASKLAARAARFSNKLPGNRYKELEEMRIKERKAFEQQGLIKVGKTELGDAVDMRGTCERMCSEYEREFREYTREIHPFEAGPNKRMDPDRAVAAYSRSDAGAGHGESAILPSDLRTPGTLVRTLDYLFSVIMPTLPPSTSTSVPTPRKALGYSAGFIRDRTRAIRKEFAMQSSWGHEEAIASFERIARWHILCLRELQEESGTNTDMHIDSAELGRCFTSLRQQYNDRREELGVENPCPNEPEFRAYMLIYDLTSKSVSIPTSELPSFILDHPLVKLAWELRRAAQRNFDSQKEGSKGNAELGMNLINRFVKLLKNQRVPYLLSCLLEIRLREMRRSAIRALTRTYPRLRQDPIRVNEVGEVVERRMVLIKTLDKILGCEEQEQEESAWDDIDPVSNSADQEAVDISRKFGLEVYHDVNGPVGVLINLGAPYNDNRDAPYTRRWKLITEKKGSASYVDIVNGRAGVQIDGAAIAQLAPRSTLPVQKAPSFAPPSAVAAPVPSFAKSSAFSFGLPPTDAKPPPAASTSAFSFRAIPKPSSPAPQAVQYEEPPKFFACPPPDHPDYIAMLNKTPVPVSSPFAVGAPNYVPPPGQTSKPSIASLKTDPITGPIPNGTPTVSLEWTGEQDRSEKKKKRAAEDEVPPPAKAPLFSQPGFFSAPPPATTSITSSAPAGPSVVPGPAKTQISPALPPFSIPKPLSPVRSAQPPITSSPQSKKRSASSLLQSTFTKLTSSQLRTSLSHSQIDRRERFDAVPDLCDLLIDEAIQAMIEDNLSEDLGHLVKQRRAALEYQQRKFMRSEAIHQWTAGIFDRLLSAQTRRIAESALLEELKRRYLVRRSIRTWRSWAKTRTRMREEAVKKRDAVNSSLNGMGLSRNRSRAVSLLSHGESSTPTQAFDASTEAARMDSLQIDIEINHAERIKDNFFAPATFLLALARQLAQSHSLHQGHDHYLNMFSTSAFETILSVPSDDFGSPPEAEVTQWLISKFSPPPSQEAGGVYTSDGVDYTTHVVRTGDKLGGRNNMGLFVFEAPLRTTSDQQAAENIADAQDRLGALVKVAESHENRYTPSLLLMTWEDETLDELVDRLDIDNEVGAFASISMVSLQLSDDLDERFSSALNEIVPDVIIKEQVIVQMEDVINTVYPTWLRFADTAGLALNQRPEDTALAGNIFKRGVELINKIPSLAKSALGHVNMENSDGLEIIVLPDFKTEEGDLPFELVDRIAEYLEDDELKGIDDLDLALAPMRQAAVNGQPLPLIPVLQNLSYLVLGEMRYQSTIPLNLFYPTSSAEIDDFVHRYLLSIDRRYQGCIDGSIVNLFQSVTISSTSREPASSGQEKDEGQGQNRLIEGNSPGQMLHSTTNQIADTNTVFNANTNAENRSTSQNNDGVSKGTLTSIPDKQKQKQTKGKRKDAPEHESNAAKSARLLKVLRGVEKTLAEFESSNGNVDDNVNGTGVGAGSPNYGDYQHHDARRLQHGHMNGYDHDHGYGYGHRHGLDEDVNMEMNMGMEVEDGLPLGVV